MTGSDEQRPAPPTKGEWRGRDCPVCSHYEHWGYVCIYVGCDCEPAHSADRPPAPVDGRGLDPNVTGSALPVGTDPPCVKCGHMEGFHHQDQELDLDGRPLGAPYDSCFGCVQDDAGEAAWHAYVAAPVGTDSARAEAEAEARWPFGTGDSSSGAFFRGGFSQGAKWARAEEREARGE